MNSIEVTRSTKEVDQLVQDFEKNRTRKDIPALSEALMQNKLDIAQGLIDRKADVNEYAKNPKGRAGMAPIHFAQSPEAVEMLAAAGAKIDAPYKSDQSPTALQGETKLQTLALSGQPKDMPMIDALLKAGAEGNRSFGRDLIYESDSPVPLADRVSRSDMSMAAKLDVIRENTKPTIELQLLSKGKDDKGYTLIDETADFQKMMGNANKLKQQGVNIIVTEKENHNVVHAKSNLYNDVDVGRVIEPKTSPSGTFLKGRGEIIPMNFFDKLGGVDVQKFEALQQAKSEQRSVVSPEPSQQSASIPKAVETNTPTQPVRDDSVAIPAASPLKDTVDKTPPEPEIKAAAAASDASKPTVTADKQEHAQPVRGDGAAIPAARPLKDTVDITPPEPEKKAAAAVSDAPKPAVTADKQEQGADSAPVDEKGRKIILTKTDYALPDAVAGTYKVKDGKFMDKATDALRFEDHGKKLSTPVEDRVVIADMIAVAAAKNWGNLELKGTDNFKQIAWLEASARGIETKGYKPTERDLEQLDSVKRERGITSDKPAIAGATDKSANSVEVVVGRERAGMEVASDQPVAAAPAKAVQTPSAPAATVPEPVHDTVRDDRQTGKLLDHGPAKYNFNPKENDNYYVKLETTSGEKVIWGKDLERAINDAAVKPGDSVTLTRKGSEDVVVDRNKLDDKGQVVGKETIDAFRNKWEVKPVELKVERSMSDDEKMKVDGAAKVLGKALAKYPAKERDTIIAKLTEGINNGTVNLAQLPTPKVAVRSIEKPAPQQTLDRGVKQEQARTR